MLLLYSWFISFDIIEIGKICEVVESVANGCITVVFIQKNVVIRCQKLTLEFA